MCELTPLAMSQTKDELVKHLKLPPETYALMSKETDSVYVWLTAGKAHLKDNCKRKPPYDWSDIKEGSKDEAMKMIAGRGDQYTQYYWDLGNAGKDENWIAKWFLYHKFRYRDGRNRAHQKLPNNHRHTDKHANSSSRPRNSILRAEQSAYKEYYDAQVNNPGTSGNRYGNEQGYYTPAPVAAVGGTYIYDPVRDI
ncbi:uncharacterized protein L3040_008072 [Drepanopeziza brunnea f. sp. 'multigermtubi']|uniref:Uncharacterized protein n=1 Tax=Marssonina brunnea f. sp. multigermtubi (strain MB_m1) TaxID=1072389 RepID=K1WYR9_MARBU|nr:uncharacterized protein MBM_04111 [Drepanopeziza brunnea f. sp. 'multigermtubi' MB_m1]EKD17742.1 hypothetical protein MBM_04111 [Drepanopeziza brunnea f. sp. 'multigermtubi' MB_m1]KAJ5035607.1 hypothetical protein L3040_008072 [Drepanopeziza brunnea f. sp. 'multigermtubi']